MGPGTKTAKGVAWNWAALALNYAVLFFLSPFIVNRLGTVAYGVWVLVVSVTSYMGLLDLGLRGAVTRFVSRDHAKGDYQEVSRTVSAALWVRQWVAAAVLVASTILSFGIADFFDLPQPMQRSASWAVIVTGASLAVTLFFGVFGGVLEALHRFDLLSVMTVAHTAMRAGGAVWALKSGHGILTLALVELGVNLVVEITIMVLAFRVCPNLKVTLAFPKAAILKKLWSYSSYLIIGQIAGQVIYYTDNIVVGKFLTVGAVAFFAVGSSIGEYVRAIVASMTTTFMPIAGRYSARGGEERLQQLLVYGTRAAVLVALPIQVTLFFRGETFINLWMGETYGFVSSRVLNILLLSQLFTVANSTSINIALGLAKHQRSTMWSVGEAAANLLLSIILVRNIGLYGVAWGTVIPSLCVHLFLWPRYISRIVDLPLRYHVWQSWFRPVLATVPFAVGCYLTARYWSANSLPVFFAQIAAILPLHLLGIGLLFRRAIAAILQEWVQKWKGRVPSDVRDRAISSRKP